MKGFIYICAAFAGLVLSFFSLLLAGSGGTNAMNSIGMYLVVAYVVCWSLAAVMAIRGNVVIAALALFSPLLVVLIVMSIYLAAVRDLGAIFEKDPPKFTVACKQAGEWFYAKPSASVHSIAYVWTDVEPMYNFYKVGFNGRITGRGQWDNRFPQFDQAIRFKERRRIPVEPPRGIGMQYLTADVVVNYQAPADPGNIESGPPQEYELTVSDRRDGRKIALMRYFLGSEGRVCGPIKDRALSEKAFLAKALDLQ